MLILRNAETITNSYLHNDSLEKCGVGIHGAKHVAALLQFTLLQMLTYYMYNACAI